MPIERNFNKKKFFTKHDFWRYAILHRIIPRSWYKHRYSYFIEDNASLAHQVQSHYPFSKHSYFVGCFQNLAYFRDILDILRAEFRLKIPLDSTNLATKKYIQSTKDSVFLHIRRGDYLVSCNRHFARLDANYYNRALEIVKERLEKPHIFVFSNDICYCKEHFLQGLDSSLVKNMTFDFIENNTEGDASIEMELMRSCKNAIIANSTFSYWAAMLLDDKDRIIITPRAFFDYSVNHHVFDDPCFKNYEDKVFPRDWIRI